MGVKAPSLVIPNGETESNVVRCEHMTFLGLQTPGTLDAATFDAQISIDGVAYVDHPEMIGLGVDEFWEVDATFVFIKIVASAPVAADRTFLLAAVE